MGEFSVTENLIHSSSFKQKGFILEDEITSRKFGRAEEMETRVSF